MTVYIEYAFLENFLFDGILLFLSLKWAKLPVNKKKIIFSAALGGVFAILFPLLSLGKISKTLLKILLGALLSLLVNPPIKTKKDRGRYALSFLYLLLLTFFFGGALTAFLQEAFSQKAPISLIALGFLVLTAFTLICIEKFHKKRAVNGFLYDCILFYKGKEKKARGFLDSGNMARKNCLPVCFLSPELFFELFGDDIIEGGGQVCDEIAISTVVGEKKYSIYKGEMDVGFGKKEVYFANFTNMLSKDYEVIISAFLFEE